MTNDTEQSTVPAAPECERQAEIVRSGKAPLVQEFIDWLLDDKKWVLARYVEDDERTPNDGIYGEQPVPVFVQREELMAEFFGIDLNKIEAERRALLDHLRSQQ